MAFRSADCHPRASTKTHALNDLLPPFQRLRSLGEGATGEVHLARATAPIGPLAVGREFALKELHEQLLPDDRARAAFAREALAGRTVDQDGLVHVHATGETDGRPWIALQLVPGTDLRRVLDERGALPEPHLRRAAQRIASALAALHAAGWVHGDVKPENLRMDDEGRVVLIDLGFARRPGDSETKHLRQGSPAYLAPEQDAGAEGDERSEVHTLGQVLYELAVGRHPFADEHGHVDAELPQRRKRGDQALASHHHPGLSPFLDLLLAEMLDVDPAQRPTATQVAERFAERETGAWWRAQLADRRRTRLGGGRRHLIPLVGRRQELEALADTWTRVAETGRAEVVHLVGPSGSGKSRLVSELAERARRSERPPMVLYGRSHQEEERRPCEPILGWLRRALLLPTGAPPGPREELELRLLVPPAETIALLEALNPASESRAPAAVPVALAAWLAALSRERPLLLFFDDLGWADEGSLEVLARAAHALEGSPSLLLLGERSGQRPRRAAARARLNDALSSLRMKRIELAPLDERAVEELVVEMFHHSTPRLRLAQVLWERSRGNPGLLNESLRGLVRRGDARQHPDEPGLVLTIAPDRLPLPKSVGTAIQEAFRQLAPADQRWLARMAVAGGRIRADFLLRAWPHKDPRKLDESLARLSYAGWLTPAGDRFRFARPAQREALLRGIPEARRRALHADVARALAPGEDGRLSLDDAFQRAYHLRAAKRPAELLELLRPLLVRALERGQPQRVHSLTKWGLEAIDSLPTDAEHQRELIGLLEAATDAADRLGRRQEQREFLDRLTDLDFDPINDPQSAARVYHLHARYALSIGQYGAARGMLRNAAELFERAEEPELTGRVLRRLAAIQAHVGELDEARRLVRKARDLAEAPLDLALAELTLGVVELLGDELESALRRGDRALRLLRTVDDFAAQAARAQAHILRARVYRCVGRPRRGLASAQRALRAARSAGERRLEAEAGARLGGQLLEVDQSAEAEERLRESLRLATEIEDQRGQAVSSLFLGILLAEAGDSEAAAMLQRACDRALALGLNRLEAVGLSIEARMLLARGELARAHACSERAMDLLERNGAEWMDRTVIVGTRAVLLEAAGEEDEAEELVLRLERRLRKLNDGLSSPLLRRRQRLLSRRLLEAVLSHEGPVFPRVSLLGD